MKSIQPIRLFAEFLLFACVFIVLSASALLPAGVSAAEQVVRITLNQPGGAAPELQANDSPEQVVSRQSRAGTSGALSSQSPATVTEGSPRDGVVLEGRLLADYRADNQGFLALESDDGQIHLCKASDILSCEKLDTPFSTLNKREMIEKLRKEFGASFDFLSTSHFIFVYNTSEGYASWCGKLFESLYDAFERYRDRKGFKLDQPEGPMIVILFGSKSEFLQYANRETPGADKIVAYYHRLTNRTVLYDLSEQESHVPKEKRRSRTYKQIDAILSRPQAAYNVATIVHEATHQITFNRKMFPRTGPFPLWFAEGLAMLFETPDENASRGWSFRGSVSRVNRYRYTLFRQFYKPGLKDPMKKIIGEEDYMNDIQRSYAFSWALFCYLNEKNPKKLVQYVELVQEKVPFTVYSREDRLHDFEDVFGDDWREFYRTFTRFMNTLR